MIKNLIHVSFSIYSYKHTQTITGSHENYFNTLQFRVLEIYINLL
jgi:hypothetical protein